MIRSRLIGNTAGPAITQHFGVDIAERRRVSLGAAGVMWVIPGSFGICVTAQLATGEITGPHCESSSAALTEGVLSLGQRQSGDPYQLMGIVPDGNAVVVAHFRSGAATTVPVTHNAVEAELPKEPRSVTFTNASDRPASVPFGG